MDNSKNWIFGMVLVVAVICLSIVTAGSSYRASAPIKARLSSNIQPAPPVCGNGFCQAGETIFNCYADCGNVCGNNLCEPVETNETCSQDCELIYSTPGLTNPTLILSEDPTYINENFDLNILVYTSSPGNFLTTKLSIKKYNLDEYAYYDTNDCQIVGQLPNYEYINPIILIGELEFPNTSSNKLTLKCNGGYGYYEFTINVWGSDGELYDYVNKEILIPE